MQTKLFKIAALGAFAVSIATVPQIASASCGKHPCGSTGGSSGSTGGSSGSSGAVEVPAPAGLGLFALGVMGLVARRRRSRA